MLIYLIRRLLLFVPTLIGATFIVFMIMALSPIDIVATLLPPGGELLPGEKAAREEYVMERYGLNDPPPVQYLRWLNNVSPVGFRIWKRGDREVEAAKKQQTEMRDAKVVELRAAGSMKLEEIEKETKKIDIRPNPGQFRFDKPAVKWPDLGESFIQSRSVAPIIGAALPVTLTLQLIALPFALTLAMLSGIWSAVHRGRLLDIATGTVLLGIYSVPVILLGTLFIGFLANVQYIRIFPAAGLHSDMAAQMRFFPGTHNGHWESGYLLDWLWHLAGPVLCISYVTLAYYSKLTRTALLETLNADFVRTARAKGLDERVVLFRHAFRNSLIPLITVAASFLPAMVVGSIVVETIFNINGMGRLAIEALKANDRELFLSTSMLILILQLTGFLIADILYAVADPRVSYDS